MLATSDEKCDRIIHAHGRVLMVLPVSKQCAQEIVDALRKDEERESLNTPPGWRKLYDWHFAAGRAVFKVLTEREHGLALAAGD